MSGSWYHPTSPCPRGPRPQPVPIPRHGRFANGNRSRRRLLGGAAPAPLGARLRGLLRRHSRSRFSAPAVLCLVPAGYSSSSTPVRAQLSAADGSTGGSENQGCFMRPPCVRFVGCLLSPPASSRAPTRTDTPHPHTALQPVRARMTSAISRAISSMVCAEEGVRREEHGHLNAQYRGGRSDRR